MPSLRLPLSVLIAASALLPGCAATPADRARDQAAALSTQQKLDARLAGFTAEPATDCIQQFPTSHSDAYGSKIVYSATSNRLYVNETSGGCESMERGDYLVTVSHTGQLCRGDIGRTFTPTINVATGSCALGSFTPYVRNSR